MSRDWITATEAAKGFGAVIKRALAGEKVVVTSDGEPVVDIVRHQRPAERAAIPLALIDAIPSFERRWAERLGAMRKKPTFSAEQKQLAALVELLTCAGAQAVVACVDQATRGGYQGIFPEQFARGAGNRPGGRRLSEQERFIEENRRAAHVATPEEVAASARAWEESRARAEPILKEMRDKGWIP